MTFAMADRPPTFRTHIEQMQRDLVTMAHELNRQQDWDAGARAQACLLALDHLISADVDLDDAEYFGWPLPAAEPSLENAA